MYLGQSRRSDDAVRAVRNCHWLKTKHNMKNESSASFYVRPWQFKVARFGLANGRAGLEDRYTAAFNPHLSR